jgi:hypothetical protein
MEHKLSPMEHVMRVFYNTHTSMLNSQTYRELTTKIVDKLSEIGRRRRFYSISDRADFSGLWDSFRNDTDVTQYVLDSTAQFHLMLSQCEIDFDRLVELIARALGANRGTSPDNNSTKSVIDMDVIQRLPVTSELQVWLNNNPWYVTLYLWAHADQDKIELP